MPRVGRVVLPDYPHHARMCVFCGAGSTGLHLIYFLPARKCRSWWIAAVARNIRVIKFYGSHSMKQNITLALDREVLVAARVFAAQRGTSVSAMLAEELIERDRRQSSLWAFQTDCAFHAWTALVAWRSWRTLEWRINNRGALKLCRPAKCSPTKPLTPSP